MATSFLYRLWSRRKSDGHVIRWHLATKPGYQSAPTDDPANLPWMPWVVDPIDMSLGFAYLAQAKGAIGSGPGRLTLENTTDPLGGRSIHVYDETAAAWVTVSLGARPLNALVTDYALAGWTFEEWVVEDGAPFATAVLRIRGTMEVPAPARSQIVVSVRDRTRDFDTPILSGATYTGGGGLGGGEDLTDKTKERFFGWGYVEPTYLGVIGGLHTYSVNGGNPIEGAVTFWDEAFRLTKITSGTPTGGQWKEDPATGILSVGGDRPKVPLCEVKGDKTGGVWRRYVGEVMKHLADGSGFTTVNAASVAALDATPRTIGLWLPPGSTTTFRQAFDKAAGSIARGYWYLDGTGEMFVGRLPAPGTPEASYRRGSTTTGLKPRETADRGLPTTKVVLRFAEVPNPLRTAVANATEADAGLLKNRWREATAEDPAVAANYPRVAQTATIETQLFDRTEATAEAGQFLADMAEPELVYDLPLINTTAADIDLADTVGVTDDIATFETGRNVIVIGRTLKRKSGNPTLTVRG
ncbi:MAG TPA: hypothetical protein VEB64_09605 [Azospirillaceae bacterium]|nr:hypothetical protein [Azospirillaceae bacterium]